MIPMLAVPYDAGAKQLSSFLTDRGCGYELKLDGVRILASRAEGLRFRSERSADVAFAEIRAALDTLALDDGVLDGEIVTFDAEGRPSFAALASRLHHERPRRRRGAADCVYLVFDVLRWRGQDVADVPLRQRRALLDDEIAGALSGSGGLIRVHPMLPEGTALWSLCDQMNLEGIVRKNLDSPYLPGPQRSRHWVKLRRDDEDDFVIVGYTEGDGARGQLGSFILAEVREGALHLVGSVGSGLGEQDLRSFAVRLQERRTDRCAAEGVLQPQPKGRPRHFVEPTMVIRVRHHGRSPDGNLRFPVFRGLRVDLTVDDLLRG